MRSRVGWGEIMGVKPSLDSVKLACLLGVLPTWAESLLPHPGKAIHRAPHSATSFKALHKIVQPAAWTNRHSCPVHHWAYTILLTVFASRQTHNPEFSPAE